MRTLDRLWTGLLALAVILLARDAASGAAVSPRVDPVAVYHKAWSEIAATFVDTKFAGQNWSAWEHKFDASIGTMSDARDAIKSMTESLGDKYTRVAQVVSDGGATPAGGLEATKPEAPKVTEPFVSSRVMGDVGYVRVASFASRSMVREFTAAVDSFGATKRIIIDLRGNRGGSVSNALEIADTLLESGDIMTTVSRDGRKTISASGLAESGDKDLIVLVDENTASASEILTGALHDNHRAVVIGHKTFGKGLIQEVTPLPGGELMLYVTSAHYLTPSGNDINGRGIDPDVATTSGDDALQTAIEYFHSHS